MSRLFIAVVPTGLKENPDLKAVLAKMKRTMSDRGQDVRWTPPDLWHVTLEFLGQLPADRRPLLNQALIGWAPQVADVRLELQGFGAFPSPEEARVLWLGVKASQAFLDLQSSLAEHLRAQGFTPEEREYRPHLTVARFRNHVSASELVNLGGRKRFGEYAVGEAVLFESVLQGNILKYVPVLRKPFQ